MGRSPDYKASLTATLGANAEFYEPYQDNARRWYRRSQERCLFLNHALVILRLTKDARPMKSPMCTSMLRKKPTPASLSVEPRLLPRVQL